MKLILLHGNGLVALNNKLSKIKEAFDPLSIVYFSGKEKGFDQILIELATPSLFSSERLVILENVDEKINLADFPKDENLSVVLKFSKSLIATSTLLKSAYAMKAQVIEIKEDQEISIFPFLDLLTQKKPQSLDLLEKIVDAYGIQYILTMLFYMLRRLILPPKNTNPRFLNIINIGKKNFPQDVVKKLYKEIILTDFKIKSGLVEERVGLNLLMSKFLFQTTF